jgi:hypothetical protein
MSCSEEIREVKGSSGIANENRSIESIEKKNRVIKKDSNSSNSEFGSVDYYLSNSLNYAPYVNLSFALTELTLKIKKEEGFKSKLISKFNNHSKEMDYLKGYPTVDNQINFFLTQLKELECCDSERDFIISNLSVNDSSLSSEVYSTLFRELTEADGAAHWEISNALFTMTILEGNKVLEVKNVDEKVFKGYVEWVDKLDTYCFVAMSNDNVPRLIIERKINYLLGSIDKVKHPEFYKRLEMAEIRVVD